MSLRVKCPRCGRYLTAHLGESDVECNCHLYCSQGSKPSDCTVTEQAYSGSYNWPRGLHGGVSKAYDDETNRTYYCSVHSEYYSKPKFMTPVDWLKLDARAKSKERYFGDGT